jgi:aminoglycoside phosphotransferase (APT) family kinase protein
MLVRSRPAVALNDHGAQMTAVIRHRISARLDTEPISTPLFGPIFDNLAVLGQRLADSRPTVVHGELFPSNVVVRDERAYLLDWESAGVGAGELDLATLTAGDWGPDTLDACRRAYSAARWPIKEPPEFGAALAAARVLVIAQLAWRKSRREALASSTVASLAIQVTQLLSEVWI